MTLEHNNNYWDSIARKTPVGQDYDYILAEHYRCAHLNLISKWTIFSSQQAILKTDLFAEAICPSRSFTWEIMKASGSIIGIDISSEICRLAEQTSAQLLPRQSLRCVTCDLRKLPFNSCSFDLIISDSTLDHYKIKKDIEISLKELIRVLKPGGTLIITMDNKTNFTEPLFRLWIVLGLAPFFIGKTYSIKELQKTLFRNGLDVLDSGYLIHNPRFFTKLIISILRRISPRHCDRWTRKALNYFDNLNEKPTKNLTAQFIAVKAVKQVH